MATAWQFVYGKNYLNGKINYFVGNVGRINQKVRVNIFGGKFAGVLWKRFIGFVHWPRPSHVTAGKWRGQGKEREKAI